MGFTDLALVAPRDPKILHRHKVVQRASGAKDVLTKAQVFSSIDDAAAGWNAVCGTGMPFDMYNKRVERDYIEPRLFFDELLSDMRDRDDEELRIALLFGSEKKGKMLPGDLHAYLDRKCNSYFIIWYLSLGLQDTDMDKCTSLLGIPTNPAFGSLNVAAAVQLIAYDWRMALGGHSSYS